MVGLLSAPQVESLANGLAGALGASIGCYCVAPLGLIVTTLTSQKPAPTTKKSDDDPGDHFVLS
jgi:hypothetical protein